MSVTLYGKPGCQQCNASERKLVKLKIPFTKVDVSKDEEAYNLVASLGYNQVPVTMLEDGTHWYGFKPDMLDALVVPASEGLAEAS